MKRNDAMGWVVYILMLAIAAVVGFTIIRPELSNSTYAAAIGMNSIVFVLIAVLSGLVLTALLVELGHLVGAKIGGYRINKFNVLGFQWKRKNGKMNFSFSFNFDGLTGETSMAPKDVEKSNPRHAVYFPMLFMLLEVIACIVVMVIGKVLLGGGQTSWEWAYIFGLIVLVVLLMIFIYQVFPSALDAKNDGYLLTILNNKTNVIAYNNILLAEEAKLLGETIPETPIYTEVTDFVDSLNRDAVYKALEAADYAKALEINDYTISSKAKVSSKVYNTAISQKISIELLYGDFEKAKEEYISLPIDEKKFIAGMSNAPATRAFILISGLIDRSEIVTKDAFAVIGKVTKAAGPEKKDIEEKLMKEAIKKIKEANPEWDFSDYTIADEETAKEEVASESANEKTPVVEEKADEEKKDNE